MNLPNNITEKQFVETVDRIANRLARRFRFGYHDVDDIKQQARFFAIEAMPKYDSSRPLENFLWKHVKNRLCNYKRDKYERHEKPCAKCQHFITDDVEGDRCCLHEDENQEECRAYSLWVVRNNVKKRLMNTVNICSLADGEEKHLYTYDDDNLVYSEMLEIINKYLSVDLRKLFLKITMGNKVSSIDRRKVQEAVRQILQNNGY